MRNTVRKKNRKPRGQKKLFFLYVVLLLMLVCTVCLLVKKFTFPMQLRGENLNVSKVQEQQTSDTSWSMDGLQSANAILVRSSDQQILAQKNSEQQIYPASLTKIMTTIVALEHLENLEETTQVRAEMFERLQAENASMAGFLPGENVKIADLLYGIMLPSGAECSEAIAEKVAGSQEAFVELMNEKAKSLGMTQTHFMNVTGLQDPQHYSTVEDLSVLLLYALQNETFRSIFTAFSYATAPTDLNPQGITFYNTMFKEMDASGIQSEFIEGGKTGYTSEAGLCLASLGKVGEEEYVLVTANANGNHQTAPYHIEDAIATYQYLQEQ
ncbi:MAG: D-alanyl-D-alanine carboxypeptidase family protein [Lachnospiraceae bacterium]